jgi:hypothetical protein
MLGQRAGLASERKKDALRDFLRPVVVADLASRSGIHEVRVAAHELRERRLIAVQRLRTEKRAVIHGACVWITPAAAADRTKKCIPRVFTRPCLPRRERSPI